MVLGLCFYFHVFLTETDMQKARPGAAFSCALPYAILKTRI